MDTTFQFSEQLCGEWETAKQYLSDGIDLLGASITQGYTTEHNIDDTHKIIHATGAIYERSRHLLTAPKNKAIGEWIDPVFQSAWFGITGAGNSWVVSNLYNQPSLSYMLLGTTMVLNFNATGVLTVATATSQVTIAIPDGYRIANTSGGTIGRAHRTLVHCIATTNHQVLFASAWAFNSITTLTLGTVDGSNLVTDPSFTVYGQLALEVVV